MTTGKNSLLMGLATTTPNFRGEQSQITAFFKQVAQASLPEKEYHRTAARIDQISKGSGIETRASVLSDFLQDDPKDFQFFPPNWALNPFPDTAARMRLYEERGLPLAESAARQALAQAGLEPDQVTHLVFATCTGLFAPGPDILLAGRLGLRPTIVRTLIGFMGCYAGFSALRVADDAVRSREDVVALVVCLELCSLHVQKDFSLSGIISNMLFADGCSAAVVSSQPGNAEPLAEILVHHSYLAHDSLDQMTWNIGQHGFQMALGAQVPFTIRDHAPGVLAALLDQAGKKRCDVAAMAVHPGGPKILDCIRDSLALQERDLASASAVLRNWGNMSSATLGFVLQSVLQEQPQGLIAAFGFGPGLTVESCLLDPC